MIALQLNKIRTSSTMPILSARAFYPGTDVSIFYGDEPVKEPYDMEISRDYQEEETTITVVLQRGRSSGTSQTEAVDYDAEPESNQKSFKIPSVSDAL